MEPKPAPRPAEHQFNTARGEYKIVPLDHVVIDPNNPRRSLRRINGLSETIKTEGLLGPLIVTPFPTPAGLTGDFYRILDGERRYEAAKAAGKTEVETCIRSRIPEHVRLRQSLISTLQREDLEAVDMAMALQTMLGSDPQIRNQKELARALGVETTWVSQMLQILKRPASLLQKVGTSQLSISVDALVRVARLDDAKLQAELVDALLEGASNASVRAAIKKRSRTSEPRTNRRVFVTGDSISVIVQCQRQSGGLTVPRVMHALEKALKRVSAMMIVVAAVVGFASAAHRLDAACPHYSMDLIAGPSCGGNSHAAVTGLSLNNLGDCCGYMSCPGGHDKAVYSFNAGPPTFVPLPAGTIESRATAVNDNRVIVGAYMNTNMPGYGNLGFVWDGARLTTILPLAGGTDVEPEALNSSGAIVGGWGNTGMGPYPLAFRWQDGVLQNIDDDMTEPGESIAYDITDSGLITGWMGTYVEGLPKYHAFIWNDGKVTDLGFGDLPGCFATEGRAINSKGQVAGIWWKTTTIYPFFVRRGFFWDGTQLIDLGTWSDNVPDVFPQDIDENGNVVGALAIGGAFVGGFLWHEGVLQSLAYLVTPGILNISAAYSINSAGQILAHGSAFAPLGEPAARLTPIPTAEGDATCDLQINVDDILAVINHWGSCVPAQPCFADLNDDFTVNQLDLLTVLENWK